PRRGRRPPGLTPTRGAAIAPICGVVPRHRRGMILGVTGSNPGDADLDIEEVLAGELAVLTADVRADPAALARLLHNDFVEFGMSGRISDRAGTVAALAGGTSQPVQACDMRAVRVGPDAVLVTYRARRPDRVTLRSSLWVRLPAGWRLLFHQGTLQPCPPRG